MSDEKVRLADVLTTLTRVVTAGEKGRQDSVDMGTMLAVAIRPLMTAVQALLQQEARPLVVQFPDVVTICLVVKYVPPPTEEPAEEESPEAVEETVEAADEDAVSDSVVVEARIPEEVEPPGDDLESIVGIGPVFAARLQEAGISTFAQLASTSAEDLARITEQSLERVIEEGWVGQARKLAGLEDGQKLLEEEAPAADEDSSALVRLNVDLEPYQGVTDEASSGDGIWVVKANTFAFGPLEVTGYLRGVQIFQRQFKRDSTGEQTLRVGTSRLKVSFVRVGTTDEGRREVSIELFEE